MQHWIQLLIYEIQELHDAEMRLLDFWPKMAEKATNPWFKEALGQQADVTEGLATRLELVARMLSVAPDEVCSKGMKGLIWEAGNLLGTGGDPQVLDCALLGAARKIEHYGLAGYYTARQLAQKMDLPAIAEMLELSLAEVIASHETLAVAAEGRSTDSLRGVAGG